MKSNRNIKLLILVALLGVAALLVTRDWSASSRVSGLTPGSELLPGLDLAKAAGIRVSTTNRTSEVRRDGEGWKSVSLAGYPAREETVVEQMLALKSLRVGQVLPGGEKTPADFGLGKEGEKVEILDAEGRALAALTLGRGRVRPGAADSPFGPRPEGRYVMPDEGPVVLVDADLSGVSSDPLRWVNPSPFSLSSLEISRIAISATNESAIVKLDGEGKYSMAGLAEDEEVNPGTAGRLERALQVVQVSGILDAKTPLATTGLDKAAHFVAEARDGVRYTVSIGAPVDAGRYATFSFAYEPPAAPSEPDAAKVLEGQNPTPEKVAATWDELKKAHAEKVKTAQDKLAALKKQEGWVYILPSYMADDMTPKKADLVKKKTPPAAPPAVPGAENGGLPMPPSPPVAVYSEPVAVTNQTAQAGGGDTNPPSEGPGEKAPAGNAP